MERVAQPFVERSQRPDNVAALKMDSSSSESEEYYKTDDFRMNYMKVRDCVVRYRYRFLRFF